MNYCDFLLNATPEYIDNIALIDAENDRKYTYRELQEKVKNLASYLIGKGLEKKTVIATYLYNSAELVIAHLAIQYAGFVSCLLDPLLKPQEIPYHLEDSEAKILFSHTKVEDFPPLHHNILIISASEIESIYEKSTSTPLSPYNFEENDLTSLFYTSGTTNKPKGVMLAPRCYHEQVKIIKTHCYPYTPEDKLLDFVPFSHVFASKFIFLGAISSGSTFVILKTFQLNKVLETIEKYKITHLFGVPSHYQQLIKKEEMVLPLKKLKYAFCATAPLPVDAAQRWKELVGFYLDEGYGLTETCTLITFRRQCLQSPIGNVGIPPKGILQVEVVDEEGNRLPPETQGEIRVKGKTLMLGYLKRPEETQRVLRDGYVYTGDSAYMTEKGEVVLCDRKKSFINIAGKKVAPFEIETVINEHPCVLDSAVIAISSEVYGQVPKAYVRLKPEAELTERQLIKYIQEKLANYKVPREVCFMKEFPYNNIGKIDKNKLLDIHHQEKTKSE